MGMEWIGGAAVLSVAMFLLGILALRQIVIRLPDDFLTSELRVIDRFAPSHPVLWAVYQIGKHLLAFTLIGLGLVMLVTPGQGVLSLVAGLMLLEFPGKHRLVQWLLGRPAVLATVNRIRQRAGKLPLSTGRTNSRSV